MSKGGDIQLSCNEMAAYDRTSIILICFHGQKERELCGENLLICIEYRYYSSFQGRIWGQRTLGKHISFRSVLELMRMINEIVELGEEL
ncbi:MAG: hypothetical protein LBT06_12290 [Hungatella sp.]|nr:hypothetical protein [Hungatella sp.]